MGSVALLGMGANGAAPRHARPRGRLAGPAAGRPRPGVRGRLRPVGPRHRRHPAARATLARRARALAAPVAGRGGRRPGGRPARLHAAGRGDLGPGQPGGGRGQPARGPRRRAGDRARAGGRGAHTGWAAAGPARAACGGRWCVAWIVAVAEHGAALPTPAVGWGTGPVALALLAALSRGRGRGRPAAAAPAVRPGWRAALLLVVAVLVRAADPRLAARRVGAGRLRRRPGRRAGAATPGPGTAVVVDAGPEPAAVDRCLDRLGVDAVPLLVLTHFHADHVDGLAGVLAGRRVGEVEMTRLARPARRGARGRRAPPPGRAGRRARAVRRDPPRSVT